MNIVIKVIIFILGAVVSLWSLLSALRTLILPRSAPDPISGVVFRSIRKLFHFRVRWLKSYQARDGFMAYYAPVSLLVLPAAWLFLVLIGFMAMFWACGISSWEEAFVVSGSSLLTLGFARGETLFHAVLSFSESAIGLALVALLIAYLPTMYSAFSRRENAVTLLEIRAGSPPSALEMILRYHRNQGLNDLHESWKSWEIWFAQLEESHTAFAALVFFRSPQPDHSWVTASGAVLDAAALSLSTLDIPWDAQAALCTRAGYLALSRIAGFFRVEINPNPKYPDQPISVTREEYDLAYERLVASGIPVKSDQEQAWLDFAGWRVNYDVPLMALSRLTMALEAPWSSDRALPTT
jgi:hypothetical protein